MAVGLGKAFIEIHADTRPFNKELAALLGVAIAAAEAAIRPKARKLGETIGEETAEGVRRAAPKMSRTVNEEIKRVRPKIDVDVDVDRNRIRRLFGAFSREFVNLGRGLFTNLFKGATTAGETIKALIANLFNVPATSPLATVLTVLVVVLLPALIGLLTLAAAAVSDLIGLLGLIPAGLAVILGIIGPLVVAFHGLGDALDLVFEKDPKKLKEGLKELTPTLQGLVGLLRKFAPIFREIQKVTQKSFFGPILKTLEPTLKKLLPIIGKGFAQVGAAAGRLVADLIAVLSNPAFVSFLQKLFPTIERIFRLIGPPLVSFMNTLAIVAERTLPIIERLVQAFGRFLDKFGGFILESIENGDFDRFIENAVRGMDNLLELSGALWDLFGVIFDELDVEGRAFVDLMTTFIKDLTDFFQSPEGKEFLNDLADAALLFVEVMRDAIPVTLLIFGIVVKIAKALLAAQAIVNAIIRGINQILGRSTDVGANLGRIAAQVGARPLAEGDIVRKATFAVVGEDGPEAVVPLTKPQRAAQIMKEAGLTGFGNVTVIAQFGAETIEAMSVRVIDQKLDQQARELAYGPRGS